MFWPLILPFEVTFWSLIAVVAVLSAFGPKLRWRRGRTCLISSALACLAFIPSCTAVMYVVDLQRFGIFEYDTFDDVNDFRVERYLPPAAKRITVQKYSSGFRAKYSVAEADLKSYLDDLWTRYGDRSVMKRSDLESKRPVDRDRFVQRYGDLGWVPLDDAAQYHTPAAANGAGAEIWFSPTEGFAYEQAGYW